MFFRPSLVLFAITQAALTGAAVRGTNVLTAPPAFQPTDAPSPALSYTLSCPGCQTIPIITTDNIYTTTSMCPLYSIRAGPLISIELQSGAVCRVRRFTSRAQRRQRSQHPWTRSKQNTGNAEVSGGRGPQSANHRTHVRR